MKGDFEIIVSTNDSLSIEIASKLYKEIGINSEPKPMCSSTSKIGELIWYIANVLK